MDNRFWIALALSAGVLVLWFGLVVPAVAPPKPEMPPETEEGAAPPMEKGKKGGEWKAPAEKKAPPEKVPGDEPDPEAPPEVEDGEAFEPTQAEVLPDRVLENEYFEIVLTNEGAALKAVILKDYLDPSQTTAYPLIGEIEEGVRSFLVHVDGVKEDLGRLPWEAVAETGPNRVEYRFQTSNGFELTKFFALAEGDGAVPYTFRVGLTVKNLTDGGVSFQGHFSGPAGIPEERDDHPNVMGYVAKGVSRDDPTVKEVTPSGVAEKPETVELLECHYFGLGNKYFGAVLIPDDAKGIGEVTLVALLDSARERRLLDGGKGAGEARKGALRNLQPLARLKTPKNLLPADAESAWEFTAFAGPKKEDLLEALRLEGIRTSFSGMCFPTSWTRGLSWVMLKLLIFFNAIIGNFGIAILMLTFLVRAFMFPLSIRMQISMNEYQKKMKKIQPKMAEIKERYKDKQRQQQEMAKLMREHGVSLLPIKGCLPIFLQFPIFIALFFTLRNSLELRHGHFLWIRDLAAPDHLFRFPPFVSDLPLIGGALGTHFNLLPVLWIVMMLLQQRITPQAQTGDAQMQSQKKMMLIMSIVFGFLFFTIESGCVLYIVTSTVWGMGESYIIRRRIKAQETA